ncbi:hypothetical protein CEXT_214911 [Caerostris extrusa]|uniref:Uncharacterized protein n=1 Tax=Caerostris extrusa TaxID=172846 RepID=A0AAV4M5E9_CAEEX|nr:hypothetical protein CEXT_214911 [Caerostris extrusa]
MSFDKTWKNKNPYLIRNILSASFKVVNVNPLKAPSGISVILFLDKSNSFRLLNLLRGNDGTSLSSFNSKFKLLSVLSSPWNAFSVTALSPTLDSCIPLTSNPLKDPSSSVGMVPLITANKSRGGFDCRASTNLERFTELHWTVSLKLPPVPQTHWTCRSLYCGGQSQDPWQGDDVKQRPA